MGSTKTTIQSSGSSTPTMSPVEQEMMGEQLKQYKQIVGPQTELQLQGMDLIKQMFAGGSLPGYFGEMAGGISPEAVATQASLMAKQNMPGFQQLGLQDSGVAYKETTRDIANNLLFPAEQFNIGAKQNLLNLALSGQAQVQQPIQAQTGLLSQQLQGLRSQNYSGSQTTARNPFLESFYGGMGGAVAGGFGQLGSGFATPGGLFGAGGSLIRW